MVSHPGVGVRTANGPDLSSLATWLSTAGWAEEPGDSVLYCMTELTASVLRREERHVTMKCVKNTPMQESTEAGVTTVPRISTRSICTGEHSYSW